MKILDKKTEPRVVLFQWDKTDPMNPLGLLIAYEEEKVVPVVSDFDTFLVGSKGMILILAFNKFRNSMLIFGTL